MTTDAPPVPAEPHEHTFLERLLDAIERAGNKMPDPAILFLVLCALVIVVSQILFWFDVKATFEVSSRRRSRPSSSTSAARSSRPTSGRRRPSPQTTTAS